MIADADEVLEDMARRRRMTPPSGSTATDPNRGRAYLFADSPAA